MLRTPNNLGLNQQIFDLGLPLTKTNDSGAVAAKIAELDKNFDLVMVAERMHESLILLAALLCVPLADVVALQVNARRSDVKVSKKCNPAKASLKKNIYFAWSLTFSKNKTK